MINQGGKRFSNISPKKNEQLPVVSIITVVYNAKQLLSDTLQNIAVQTYPNIEYIIIDGNSTDGTLNIIQENESHIDYWMSEPDTGLYDAMNKGLNNAKGDFVWFINAGDFIFENDTLEKIILQNKTADIFYGETAFMNNNKIIVALRSEIVPHKVPENLTWHHLNKGMVISHQSIIVKKMIAPQFNLNYSHCADIDWVIFCLKNAKIIHNTHLTLSKFLMGGHSHKHHQPAMIERFFVLQKHFGFLNTVLNHIWIVFRYIIFSFTKKAA